MKWGRIAFILMVLLLFFFCIAVEALGTDEVLEEQSNLFGVDKLEQYGEEYLNGVEIKGEMDVNSIIKTILENGKESAQGVIKQSVRSCLLLLTIVLLFGLVEGIGHGTGSEFPIVPVAAALAVTAVAVSDMFALVGMGRESMENMQTFSKVLLPSMAAATTAAGSPGAAVAKQLATILFSDFLITLINQVLLPLTYAYIAASVAYAALGNEGMKRIGGFLKWMVNTMLGVVLLVFIGYLNISGAISGSADALTVKAAKFTVSNMVPVVGGILSDAAETVLVGASLLRSAIGVFGMLVVIAICLMPFLHLGAHYLAYKGTSALAATVADSRTAGLIDAIGSAFGMVLAMTASCAMLLIISIVSAISMVTG
jgi:stage III sporulation protein AE